MDAAMRIGELSRRTGVSPELLRAWEHRYGLLQPDRSRGGFRLYSAEDEIRVRRTTALIAEGFSAAEAARVASSRSSADDDAEAHSAGEDLAEDLRRALDGFDGSAAHAAMDCLFSTFSVRFVITEILIPYLRELGDRWAQGTISVAQEHFASNLLRGRMLAIAGDWGAGGPWTAVLACPPGEVHDLGLIFFGILLARQGWRVTFLGADTPFDTLKASASALHPTLVVLATVDEALLTRHADAIAALAASTPVAVAAPVDEQRLLQLGARALSGQIADSAEELASNWHTTPSRRGENSASPSGK